MLQYGEENFIAAFCPADLKNSKNLADN